MSKKSESSRKAFHITGKHNTAKRFTGEIESSAKAQIQAVCDREEFAGGKSAGKSG
ncbi:MAG: hypothetical protein LBC14_00815 [Desulfovibrio sp.]|jgi:hypothetical protein|nr:hypothetical protein [Desulfovibrio sp.]